MMTQLTSQLPLLFKGLALFTPGGDLIYCLDPSKQGHWHAQLCMALQQLLGLSAPPLFLTPCFTATVDRWLDRDTQQLRISAEVYPRVWRYRALLSQIFAVDINQWQLLSAPPDSCDPLVISSYQQQFPQLWQSHDLVVPLDQWSGYSPVGGTALNLRIPSQPTPPISRLPQVLQENNRDSDKPQGYVLRLFVSERHPQTARVLENIHQVLDQAINDPYTLKIIDVKRHPDQAEAAQVMATPTLMRLWPQPVKKVVGGLEQTDRILQLLD